MEIPKWLEKCFAYYPITQGVGIALSFLEVVRHPTVLNSAVLIFFSYFLSPILWYIIRTQFYLSPIKGVFKIGNKNNRANAWLLSHYLQCLYNHFSFFEKLLKLVPGFYSSWLRCWGSHIGSKVIWTPGCEIVDRGYLHIGDRVLMGNNSYLSAHIIKKSNRQFLLYVKPIIIHSDCMISYANVIGPGANLEQGVQLQACSHIYPNQNITVGGFYDRAAH